MIVPLPFVLSSCLFVYCPMSWQKWHQMLCHTDRPHARSAATMRNAEGFVQVEMADIRTNGAGALRAKPQGRPKGSRSTVQPESAGSQALRDEIEYLRTKVAYLEKLQALPAKDTSRTGIKPE